MLLSYHICKNTCAYTFEPKFSVLMVSWLYVYKMCVENQCMGEISTFTKSWTFEIQILKLAVYAFK